MRRAILLSVLACAVGAGWTAAGTVNVTPSNMGTWQFDTRNSSGTLLTIGATANTSMVTGPATPPLGTGSARLSTGTGNGDSSSELRSTGYAGVPLSSLTSLSYSTYLTDNSPNDQQLPYLDLYISTDGQPLASDFSNFDLLSFEPPYQQTSTGNPSLPDQNDPGAGNRLPLDTWQTWNALEGGWYDGAIGGNGGDHVQPLSAFLTAYPNATIINYNGLGGIRFSVGFADAVDTFDGNVDNFSIGTAAATTTYNFDPNATVPLPASARSGLALLGGLGLFGGAKRMRRQMV